METVQLAGVGRFHFFGSLIGHWNVQIEFGDIKPESRNMGIAPMVPAHKILEILRQPELIDVVNTLHSTTEEKVQQKNGVATFDDSFEKSKDHPLTKDELD
jgi:hypothetical protein